SSRAQGRETEFPACPVTKRSLVTRRDASPHPACHPQGRSLSSGRAARCPPASPLGGVADWRTWPGTAAKANIGNGLRRAGQSARGGGPWRTGGLAPDVPRRKRPPPNPVNSLPPAAAAVYNR